MQMLKILKLPQYVAVLMLVLHQLEVKAKQDSSNITLQQAIDEQLQRDQSISSHLLNRKRRYLEFPEGSSFQLVYDLIIGVVDFTNYLILGVTVALAWELPSKPPSEILSDLRDRLKDGTLGTSRNDSIANIKYVETKTSNATKHHIFAGLQPLFRPPMHLQYYTQRQPDSYYRYQNNKINPQYGKSQQKSWPRKGTNYFSHKPKHPFIDWTKHTRNLPKTYKAAKYPWWNLKSRLPNLTRKQQNIQGTRRRFVQNVRNLKRNKIYKATGRADHRIFPIFGKRSINEQPKRGTLSKWDQIHIRHHRSTREDLYGRIETYLNGRGFSGHHCVLRSLCETGQKSTEQIPGSFVGEIMRAIFTLPEATADNGELQRRSVKQQRYDHAQALKENCGMRYHLCTESLWSSHFVM